MDRLDLDSDFLWGRFSCDCGDPCHTLDVSVEIGENGWFCYVDFADSHRLANEAGLWARLKAAFTLARKGYISGGEITLRKQDVPELIGLLQKALPKPSFMAGTSVLGIPHSGKPSP